MNCPNCGCENPDGSTKCCVCGNVLRFNDRKNNRSKHLACKKASVIIVCIFAIALLIVVAFIINKLTVKNNTICQANTNEYISSSDFVVAVNDDGTVSCEGDYDLSQWNDIKAAAAGRGVVVGLKNDGTVIAADSGGDLRSRFENDISKWEDIVSICTDYESGAVAGLSSNGTVVYSNSIFDDDIDFDTSSLGNVIQIDFVGFDAEAKYMCVLKEDGTVEIVLPYFTKLYDSKDEIDDAIEFANDFLNVSEWKNIKSIYCNECCVFGITESGKLQTTLNSKLIDQYFVRPCFHLDFFGDKEKLALVNHIVDANLKMFDDMLERFEKLKVSQIVVPSQFYMNFFCDFDFDLNDNGHYFFLLLEDGTVIVESPMFSPYYACKNLSGDALYNKLSEYAFSYEDNFLDEWEKYCNKCENIINNVYKFQNVFAIDTCENYVEDYVEGYYDNSSLIVLKNDGSVYSTYKHSKVNQWSNIKTTEKKHTEFTTKDKKIDEPNKNFDRSNVDTSPVETSGIINEDFYEGKYYLTYDENGEFVIYAFEIVDDNIIRVTYFEPPDFSQYTFADAYYADRKDNKLYNQDIGFEFIIDVDLQKIKYKDESRINYEVLKEVDDLSEKTLKKYAEEIL